jgi:hypothetical protein
MRAVAGLVALAVAATPAFGGEPETTPAPLPQGPPSSVPPAPQPAPAADVPPPPAEPKVDPAYGERPDEHESAPRMGPNERIGMRRGRDIVVRYHPDRTRENITMLALLGGAGLLFGGVGLYFHFDSRSATGETQARVYTGRTWTPERQETYDRAHRSAGIAGVSYGIGGVFLIATAVAYMVTEPKMETVVIHPHTNGKAPSAMVTPLPGGAFVSRGWEF